VAAGPRRPAAAPAPDPATGASWTTPAWAAAACSLCLLASVALAAPAAVSAEDAGLPALTPQKKAEKKPDIAPVLSPEERTRRRETPSKEVKDEVWYQRGKLTFVAKCAGCHPAGANIIVGSKSLFWDDMERNGYKDPDAIRTIVRYGKGKMPGYAADCSADQDVLQCGVSQPLSEETLLDVQDFVINRANADWKGRG